MMLTLTKNISKFEAFTNHSVMPATLMRIFYFIENKLTGKDSVIREVAGVSVKREQIFAFFLCSNITGVLMSTPTKSLSLLKRVKVLEKQLHTTQQELSREKWYSQGLYDYSCILHKKYKRLKSFAKQVVLKGVVKL